MRLLILTLICSLASVALAQFQFFEQMFNQGGQQQRHQQQQDQPQNVASDSEWYQRTYEGGMRTSPFSPACLSNHIFLQMRGTIAKRYNSTIAHCTNYLCPGTLACVHFPHHCPCPFPAVEDKVELGEGSAICVSKGGYKEGEAKRKIELARKGLL